MSKKTLLAASALTTLLVAGAATAHDITGTGLYAGVNNTATTSAAIKVAEELRFSATNSTASAIAGTRGNLTYSVDSSGGTYPSGQLVLTLDVSNAIFTTNLAAATVVTSAGACAGSLTSSLSSGGTVGSSSVTLIVSGFENCGTTATGDSLNVTLPIQLTGAGDVDAGFSLRTLAGDLPVDGGRSAATFIELVDAVAVEFSPVTSSAVADVAEGFEEFVSDNQAIAQLDIAIESGVYQTIALTSATTSASAIVGLEDIEDLTITATPTSGSFTGFNLAIGGTAFGSTSTTTAVSSDRRFVIGADTATVSATSYAITAVDLTATGTATTALTANAVIPATSIAFNARVDLTAADSLTSSTGAFVDFNVTGSGEIDRNGTSFVAPWLAMGSGTTTSVIRLANNGSDATGPITVRLLSTINGQAVSGSFTIGAGQVQAGSLTAEGGIAPGSAVALNAAAIASALGVTAANGDLEITVEAQPSAISGKIRNTTPTGTYEISLGNLDGKS